MGQRTWEVIHSYTHDKEEFGKNPYDRAPFYIVVIYPARKVNSVNREDRYKIVGYCLKDRRWIGGKAI